MGATAPVRGATRYPTTGATAEDVSAATAMRSAFAVKAADVGTMSAADVEMATAVRTAAVGAAVRPSSAMLTERRVRRASERERYNRCKQETYRGEFHRFPPVIERGSGEIAIEDSHRRKNSGFVLIGCT